MYQIKNNDQVVILIDNNYNKSLFVPKVLLNLIRSSNIAKHIRKYYSIQTLLTFSFFVTIFEKNKKFIE